MSVKATRCEEKRKVWLRRSLASGAVVRVPDHKVPTYAGCGDFIHEPFHQYQRVQLDGFYWGYPVKDFPEGL